jgi:hypothetical protein
MKRFAAILCAGAAVAFVVAALQMTAGHADDESSPIFGVNIPAGYRQWELIAPSHEAGGFNELRGILGNAISIKA